MSITFANPEYFLLLVGIPIYVMLYVFIRKRAGYGFSVFDDLLKARKKSMFRFIPFVRHTLIIFLFVLFTISLARPQLSHQTQDISKKGIDIAIALDASDSMRAEDLKPNRIEAAKEALQHFISLRKDDRIGVVVFTGYPFTQSPLTFDHDVLSYYINNISTDSINQRSGLGGTAIGDAILASLNRLGTGEKRTKIILLLSDGDANVGVDPVVAAYKAKETNIKIYTIGIGKEGGAPIPIVDALGRKGVARNRDGSVYRATFNEKTLKDIASITGGSFFRVDDSAAFDHAVDEINTLEKTDIVVQKKLVHKDIFEPFLFGTALLLFLLFAFELTFRLHQ